MILLPGLLCDAALWAHQTQTLADIADITVADLTFDETIEAMADRVLAGAPETFALVGLSMGGYVAQEIIRKAPGRIERLGLLDTSARPDSPEQKETRKAFLRQLEVGDFRGVTSRLLPLLIHEDKLDDEVLVDIIKASAANVGQDAYVRQQHAIMARPDARKNLENIACPTLVLCGAQDVLTSVALHEEMAEKIPKASLVVIEDCGHLTPLERPRAVMRYWLNT